MEYSKEIVREIYKAAPEEILDVLTSDETIEKISILAKKYSLSTEQGFILSYEITLYMIGLIPDSSFEVELKNSLNLTDSTEKSLKASIEQDIISKVSKDTLDSQRKLAQEKVSSPSIDIDNESKDLEIPPEILPMVEEGETAHDTLPESAEPKKPEIEAKTENSIPNNIENRIEENKTEAAPQETPKPKSAYPGGVDPYREPID